MSPVRLSSRPQHIGATRLELILVVLLLKRELVYIPVLKRLLQHEAYSTTGNAGLRWQIRVEVKLLTPYQWF